MAGSLGVSSAISSPAHLHYVNARRIVNGLDHALDIAQAATKLEQILAASLVSKEPGR